MPQLSALPLTQTDHDTIAAVMAPVTSRWPVERIILFGSKACGDDEPDSDIDLLVITTSELDRQTEDAAAVDTELVKPGLVPPECASSLRKLYQARLRSDYGDIAPTSRAEADQAVADAENIVALRSPLASRAKNGGR
jgi:predicted nucleotidyltransferase